MSSYDQNLLDAAPKATRAQLQEGYNVDLLEHPPRRTPSMRSPPPQPTPHTVPLAPLTGVAESGSAEKVISTPPYTPPAPKSRTSFWRTRTGAIIIAVIVIVVIGAVVGGAVGGTVKKSNGNTSTGIHSVSSSVVSTTTGPTATGSPTQGVAPVGTVRLPARPTETSTT